MKRTATLLHICYPIPLMLREFREATKRMEQIGRLGNPVEVRRAAEVLEAMRENIVLVAKSPFVKRIGCGE